MVLGGVWCVPCPRTVVRVCTLVSFLAESSLNAVHNPCRFISFPLTVFLAEAFFHHYMRHRVVSGGVMLVQTVCLGLLSTQFLQGSSTYAKLSVVWNSGLLPGAGGLLTATKGRANKD